MEIRAAANGEDWVNKWGDWQDGNSKHCSWHGIACNDEMPRSIIGLDLYNNGMTGTLSESIRHLRSLKHLDLSDNAISGTMPSFRLLESLKHLDLRNNNIGVWNLFVSQLIQ